MRRIIFLVAAFVCVLVLLVGSGPSASSAQGEGKRGISAAKSSSEGSLPQDSAARAEGSAVDLYYDDNTYEDTYGFGLASEDRSAGAIWLNRYSLAGMRYPVTLQDIHIPFPDPEDGNGNFVGRRIRILVYVDTNSDGDPRNATNLYAASHVIQFVEDYQYFDLNLQINQAGDLYVGWEDEWAESGPSPYQYSALVDQTAPQGASYLIGQVYSDVPNFTNLGANDYYERITDGNLFIHATVAEYVPEPPRCPGERFTDVCPGDYYYTPVLNLNDRGVISGYSSSPPCDTPSHAPCFRPNSNLTRGQGAKIVALAAGVPAATGGQRFQDVAPGSPFYNEINALAALGHMGGYPCGGPGEPCGGGNLPYFRPGANVTRGQLSKIVSNTAGYSEPHSSQSFEDVPTSGAFYIWIQRLSSRGIINGYTCGGPGEPCNPPGNRSYFRPNAEITRAQTAKIVYGVWPEGTRPAK